MRYIVHITTLGAWENAKLIGYYKGDTLETEGFIHCSNPNQVVTVANTRFRTQRDLVLLAIDRKLVKSPVREENLEGGDDLFPHIYGPLGIDSIIAVFNFSPDDNGNFDLPEAMKSDVRFTASF